MPTLEEAHQGLDSAECTFNFWPDLADKLAYYNHLIFKRFGRAIGTIVILERTPTPEGIEISGLGLGWWLSIDNDGSIIADREYIAGNNQLDNGSFETLDALEFPLHWSRTEGSGWTPTTDDINSGSRSVKTSFGLDKDDVLVSTQPRNVTAGALVRSSCYAKRLSGTVGRFRCRTVYEGRYDPADLLAEFALWANNSETPADAVLSGDDLIMGPVTQPQWVTNPSFETGDFTDWVGDTFLDPTDSSVHWAVINSYAVAGGPTVLPRTGSYMVAANSTPTAGYPQRWLGTSTGPGVNVGERWRLEGWAVEGTLASGEASLVLEGINTTGFPDNKPSASVNGNRYADNGLAGSPFAYVWKQLSVEYDIPENTVAVVPWIYVGFDPGASGTFLFDDITLTRIKGNTAKYAAPAVTVTPEKSYKLLASVIGSWPESGASRNGTLHYSILLQGTGRPDQIIVSSDLDVSQAATQFLLEHTFTPSSGYDTVTVTLVATDLTGGNVLISKPTLTCQDTSNYVVDKIIGPTQVDFEQFIQDSVAPAGTEKVHLELIAEAGAAGWVVDDVEWHRTETQAPAADVVDELLRDGDTGEYLITPGNISVAGMIGEDWRVTNTPNRTALLDFLRNRMAQGLEYRHNPDNTIDVATPEELFEVRELTLTSEKLLVLAEPKVTGSVEDRLTAAKVLGARLKRPAPLPDAVITGAYETTIPGAVDWFGNPVRRSRLIADTSVEYSAAADSRAEAEVEGSATRTDQVQFELADWIAYEDFDVGDWLGVYKPEALWEDRTNPQTDRRTGDRIFPRLSRVLERKLDMARGDGFSVWVRLADGTEEDVSRFVRWADKTTAAVTIGDEGADFTGDPAGSQGGGPVAGVRAVQDHARSAR